jgi:hypothetical protein
MTSTMDLFAWTREPEADALELATRVEGWTEQRMREHALRCLVHDLPTEQLVRVPTHDLEWDACMFCWDRVAIARGWVARWPAMQQRRERRARKLERLALEVRS